MKTYDLVIIGMLAALAAIFQVAHGVIGIPTGFGMTVDLVAVPALLAFFLFGLEHSLWVLLIASAVITLIAPDSWLGASMKFSATLPMVVVPAFYLLSRGKMAQFAALGALAFIAAIALLVASGSANLLAKPALAGFTAETLLLGLIPIAVLILLSAALLFVWKRAAKRLNPKPLSDPMIAIAILAAALAVRAVATIVSNYYYAGPIFFGMPPELLMQKVPWFLIAGWNAFQGILEFGIAWMIAYPFGFAKKYGEWKGG